MAVRNREEIMNLVKEVIGESTEESTISFLEDITDTLDDYENRLSDSTDWKEKYEENDKEWKKKYTERFFGSNETEKELKDELKDQEENEKEIKSFEDLFKEEDK